MGHDTLTVIADAVLQQLRDAGGTMQAGSVLITLPVYLDATDVHRLQMEINRHSALRVELQHRPGERRVGVRFVARSHRW
jgi:hypothetical protein